MGTKERLKKIAKRESKLMNHDIGNFVRREKEYVSWCMNCKSPIFIHLDKIDPGRIIFKIRNNSPESFCTTSGLTVKEAFPKRGKGEVYGPLMNYKCEALQKHNSSIVLIT